MVFFFYKHSSLHLHAFVDANWVGNFDDRISTSGYIIFFGVNPISWSSKKRKIVARSTTEAESRAIAIAVVELDWITNLLNELNINSIITPIIYYDNVGATYLCANPVFHSHMKHIAINFYFGRDQVVKHQPCISHVHTSD